MKPVLPPENSPVLKLAISKLRDSADGLAVGLHPKTAQAIADSMLAVQSYYTNSMEGNPSKLRDIEKALANQFNSNPKQRNFQLEHLAHIETQKKDD